MIHLSNANLSFGSTIALQACDIEVKSGEQVALIGPSGAGKSSLLKVLATEYKLTDGEFLFDGKDATLLGSIELHDLRKKIAYIPQDLALVPNLKVHQNILLGRVGCLNLFGSLKDLLLPANSKLESIHQILADLGISDKLFHRTDSLSGGQQQRVAIARAIYQKSSILLADEPVSAVDPSRAHDLLNILTQLATRHQCSLVCSLHNLDYARTYFSRLVGLRNGQIVFDGKPSQFSDKLFNELYQLNNA